MIRSLYALLVASFLIPQVFGDQLNLTIGSGSNTGLGESLASAMRKIQTNFTDVYAAIDSVSLDRVSINVKRAPYSATGNGITDDTAAIIAAVAALPVAGGSILFPPGRYIYSSKISLPSNVALLGSPPTDKIFGGISSSCLIYTGTNSPSIEVKPPASVYYETITLRDLEIDGSATGTGIDGVALLGTNGANAGVRGVFLENVTVKNFSHYQLWFNENIFHITLNSCNIENRARSEDGNDLVRCEGGAVGQITYNDCWFSQSVVGHWCHYGATHEARFIGGTVEASAGANGVYVENVGIFICGTHFESYNSARTDGIGIRYVGLVGGIIAPSNVSIFGTGIQIGNPSSPLTPATGVTIMGGYTGNNIAAGGHDLHIVSGGPRKGVMVLASATASSTNGAVVLNERFTVDGSLDVVRLDTIAWQANSGGGIYLPGGNAGSVTVPALDIGNNRIISFSDHNGAKTLGAYIYADTNDSLSFGAGNATRVWIDKIGHVGIGQSSPDASAILDMSATTLGMLPPRMTYAQRNSIASPADGLLLYQTDSTPGPRMRVSGAWVKFTLTADP